MPGVVNVWCGDVLFYSRCGGCLVLWMSFLHTMWWISGVVDVRCGGYLVWWMSYFAQDVVDAYVVDVVQSVQCNNHHMTKLNHV